MRQETVEDLLSSLSLWWKSLELGPQTTTMYMKGLKGLSDAQIARAGELALAHYKGARPPRPGDLRDLLESHHLPEGGGTKLDPALWRWYWSWYDVGGMCGWQECLWHPGLKGAGPPPPTESSWGVDDRSIPMPPPRPRAPAE